MNFSTLFHILNTLDAKSRQVCGDYSLSPPTFSLSNIYNINAKFEPLFLALQSSRVALKILYMSTYALINIGVRHVQGKNYKKFKKQKDCKSTS